MLVPCGQRVVYLSGNVLVYMVPDLRKTYGRIHSHQGMCSLEIVRRQYDTLHLDH